jgi:hypothetical protein
MESIAARLPSIFNVAAHFLEGSLDRTWQVTSRENKYPGISASAKIFIYFRV